jgi:hypothetical protein
MNAKISLVALVIAVCLKVSASSAPDPELNRHVASENAKPATLLPALIWNPHNLPSGDSLHETLLSSDYEAVMTDDLAPFVDSLRDYHLFIMAGIYEQGDQPILTEPEFRPYLQAILSFLQGGGSIYWEGGAAFTDIDSHQGYLLYDYFQALTIGPLPTPISYLLGRIGTVFDDIDSLVYGGGLSYTLDCSRPAEQEVLMGARPGGAALPKGAAAAVGPTRTMLTNFSWARLNDSGANTRVDLIDDAMNWLSGAVAVEEPEPLPQAYSLSPPYPNPFNAQVTIEYALPNEAEVSLSVFDIQGRNVATLSEGTKPAGYHRMIWDAKEMPSGLYFVRLKAGEFVETRKMVLLK